MTLDLSLDYQVWDNREAVTFGSRSTRGVALTAVADAKRRALTYKELAAANGAYTGQDLAPGPWDAAGPQAGRQGL